MAPKRRARTAPKKKATPHTRKLKATPNGAVSNSARESTPFSEEPKVPKFQTPPSKQFQKSRKLSVPESSPSLSPLSTPSDSPEEPPPFLYAPKTNGVVRKPNEFQGSDAPIQKIQPKELPPFKDVPAHAKSPKQPLTETAPLAEDDLQTPPAPPAPPEPSEEGSDIAAAEILESPLANVFESPPPEHLVQEQLDLVKEDVGFSPAGLEHNGVDEDDIDELDHTAVTAPASTYQIAPMVESHAYDSEKATESISSSKRKRSPSGDSSALLPSTRPSPPPEKRIKIFSPGPIKLNEDDFNPPYTPLTKQEVQAWKGWVEVESEPVYLNTMLRELGTRGVSIQEMWDLEESISGLQPPVYGLIFLFQYQDSDHVETGEQCPKDVWFCNQLPATNACATIALMNILLNTSNVNLGRPLSYFKEDTADLTPMERAHCVNEHEFIRGIHNSFASKIDILQSDRWFATKYRKQLKAVEKRIQDEGKEAARKAREAALPPKQDARPKRKPTTKKYEEDTSPEPGMAYEIDSAFHYVAYVPVNDSIWRLDGMNPHPQNLGEYSHIDSWMYDCAPFIQSRMDEFKKLNQHNYNLMALIKDPATRALESLAENVKLLQDIESKLDSVGGDWRSYAQELGSDTLLGASTFHDLTEEMIFAAKDADLVDDVDKLLELRSEAVKYQKDYCECIEIQQVKRDGEQLMVEKERMDLNPTIHKILLALEENGVAGELLERHRDMDAR